MTIPGPDGEALKVFVEPHEIFAPGGNRWYVIGESRDDVLASGVIVGQAYEGRVEGVVESRVSVWLGAVHAYGTVELPGWVGHIEPTTPGATSSDEQVVAWVAREGFQPPPTVPAASAHDALEVSRILFDAEQGFRNTHTNWQDWISSAFSYADSFWTDVGIDAQFYGAYGVSDLTTSTSCGSSPSVVNNYASWLANGHTVYGVNAYQLVVRSDLTDPDGCHGLAWSVGSLNSANAASVIEGNDASCCDAYNPEHQNERGHIAIHELGHLHGANHYGDCRGWWWDCNIMKSPINNYDWYGGWWTSGATTEIQNYAWPLL